MCVLVSAKLCVRTRARVCTFARQCGMCVCVCVCVCHSLSVVCRECMSVRGCGRVGTPSLVTQLLPPTEDSWKLRLGIPGMVLRAGVSASATWCTLQRVSLGVLKRDYNINARTVSEHEPTNKPTRLERKKKKKATRHSQPQRPSF